MAEDTQYDSDLERFLQETLTSDVDSLAAIDSLPSSPEISLDRRRQQQQQARHWWDDNEETETGRGFLKPVPEKESEDMAAVKMSTMQSTTGKSEFSIDSLEAAQSNAQLSPTHQSDDFNDTFSASPGVQSSPFPSRPSLLAQSGLSTHQGLDTMEELAEKERFFAQLEEGRLSPVDYGELNRQQDLTATTGTLREFDEELRKQDTDEPCSESFQDSSKKSSTPSSSNSSSSSSSSKSSSSSSSRCTSPSHEDSHRDQPPTDDQNQASDEKQEDRVSDSEQPALEAVPPVWQTAAKLVQLEASSSRDKFTKVVLDAMQYGAPEESIQAIGGEKHGFELSPVKSSASPHSQQNDTAASHTVDIRKTYTENKDGYGTGNKEEDEEFDSDTKFRELDELQAALKTAGLPLIGEHEGEDEGQHLDPLITGLVVKGAGEDIDDRNRKSASLLTLAQVQNVSSSALALGVAHSQKRDYKTYIQRDKDGEEPRESNDPRTEKEIFDLSPVGTGMMGDDPRGFDLSPALPFTPPFSPTVSTKQVVDAEVEAILEDVKKVESELQKVVKSTKKRVQTRKPLAAKFSAASPHLSETPVQSRILKKEPGYLKSTISADSRYGWKVGRSDNIPTSHQSVVSSTHSLRQTQTLLPPRKAQTHQIERPVVSRKGIVGCMPDVETAVSDVGHVDAIQLAASVDSFASYLHQFVDQTPSATCPVSTSAWVLQDQRKTVDTPTVKPLSADEDGMIKQAELKQCEQCEKLQNELSDKEIQWDKQITYMKRQHEEEMKKMKQELFVLQAKLKAMEKENQQTTSMEGNHQLELGRLEKELKEQEGLIQGYQLENERLYKEVKDRQTKTKAVESQLFAENQRQAAELVSVRSKLERCEQQLLSVGAITGRQLSEGSAVLGANQISQLEHQLQDAKQREQEMNDKLSECKEVNRMLEESLAVLKIEMTNSKDHLNQELSQQKTIADASVHATEQRLENMRVCHDKEVAAMKRQLKWYVENQEMLDKDCEKMKSHEMELERLREEVKLMKCEGKEVTDRTRRKDKERQADARRIQDLERQVREMDQVIRRRHPNSLPALIYAANVSSTTATSTTSKHQALTDSSPKHSTVFLEQKIHKLDRELATKDEEWDRKMRSLQQKHNTLQLQYEEQIAALQEELNAFKIASRTPGNTHPHTTIQALEKELENVRIISQTRIDQLQTENEMLKAQLRRGRTNDQQTVRSKARRKLAVDKEDGGKRCEDVIPKAEDEGDALAETLKEKYEEVEMLKEAYSKIEAERDQLLVVVGRQVGVGRDGVSELEEKRYNPRHFTDASHHLVGENEQLKQQVSHLQLELDHQRVQLNAHLAKAAARLRETKEEAEEKLEAETSRLCKKLETVRTESLLAVSDSEVARLKSKVAAQDVMVRHLQEQLASTSDSTEMLAASRVREEKLKQQVERLYTELRQAQEYHTPEMRHYEVLASKIKNMEQRHAQREQELRNIIFRTQQTAGVEMDQATAYWKQELEMKNQQVEKFREELDIILNVLQELKRQGIVIPL